MSCVPYVQSFINILGNKHPGISGESIESGASQSLGALSLLCSMQIREGWAHQNTTEFY